MGTSFGTPSVRDLLTGPSTSVAVGGSISGSCKLDLLDTSSTKLGPSSGNSWALQEYLKQAATAPWTDRSLSLSPQCTAVPAATVPSPVQEVLQQMALSFSAPSRGGPVAGSTGYETGSTVTYSLMTRPTPSTSLSIPVAPVGVVKTPSGEGSHYDDRIASTGATFSKSSSKYRASSSFDSRGRSHGSSYPEEEEEDDDEHSRKQPRYIPSSHSRGKQKVSSASDFACWFFKYDPVKYADCMHVHGRSSDLKYAHLKHHFQSGGVPPEFIKNMSWDEVWATLFPRKSPPDNKYYVINEMIMGILEASPSEGDDVARFLHTLENSISRDAATRRIYSLSRDRGKSSYHSHSHSHSHSRTSPPPAGVRRNRKSPGLHIPFNRIPKQPTIATPPSSGSNSSSSVTPATTKEGSEYPYSPSLSFSYRGHHHDLGLSIGTSAPMDVYSTFTSSGSSSAMVSTHSQQHEELFHKVLIVDEDYNTLWEERDLPPASIFDFEAYYLLHHQCIIDDGKEIQIHSYEDLLMVFSWHGSESCPFTLFAIRRQ
ncbi:hypothetical protein ABW21_db0209803 [Orbilia brochopaga]|nr:hypothetical protein ABW21_db0209803 [Drechslerella brochopaga]